jgi:hypothetical protein
MIWRLNGGCHEFNVLGARDNRRLEHRTGRGDRGMGLSTPHASKKRDFEASLALRQIPNMPLYPLWDPVCVIT